MPANYASLKPKHLYTTDEQFEAIWEVLGKSKDGTAAVRVPRDALMSVMMDHSKFHAEVFPLIPTIQKKPRRRRR